MNFNSTDEDETTPPLLVKDNNEEYMRACGDEIKDIVPRLQRLHVNDEQWDFKSEISNKPSSAETIPSLMSVDDEISVADSSMQVSPAVLNHMPGKISINDGTKPARGKEKSPSTSNEITHAIPENVQVGNQSQDFVQNMPANLPIHFHPVDQNDEYKLCESEDMKEIEGNRSKNAAEENTKQVDPETGELSNTLSMILPDRHGNDRIYDKSERDVLGQFDAIDGSRFNKSCSSDVPSDNQSKMNGGKMNISMSDNHNPVTPSTGLVESKRQRKIAVFANPVSQIRQRRFGTINIPSDNLDGETFKANSFSEGESSNTLSMILPDRQGNERIDDKSERDVLGQFDAIDGSRFNKKSCSSDVPSDNQSKMNGGKMNISMSDTHNPVTPSTGLVESKRQRKIAIFANPASQIRQRRFDIPSDNLDGETFKANSFSEDASKNSGVVEKHGPKKSRRRCRKIKPSTTPGFQIFPNFKDEDEKRTSPCKRKHENLMETTGKLRKSCTSECNTETQLTIEKTQSVLHQRSQSLGLKETNSSPKFSLNRKSRKRTSSDYQSVDRVKTRRSSSSSDGAENK